jgi:hypothetical protein
LKAHETNKEWVFNTERFQMSKLKEQKLIWEDQVAKVAKFVTLFEKKKSRKGEFELKVTML